MPGDVGLVAKLADTLASWLLDEAGYGEWQVRRQVEAKKREINQAIADGRWAAVPALLAELERLSQQP